MKTRSEELKELTEAFKPQIAKGSTYALELKKVSPAKTSISQDNGQTVVVHDEDIDALCKLLRKMGESVEEVHSMARRGVAKRSSMGVGEVIKILKQMKAEEKDPKRREALERAISFATV